MSETLATTKSPRAARATIAVIEIAVVFALALVLVRTLQSTPELQEFRTTWPQDVFAIVFRWVPLIAVAAAAEALLRGRSPRAWGFSVAGGLTFNAQSAAWLFILGGAIPLALTLASPPSADTPDLTGLAFAASILGPVLAQEVFLAGYVNTRLQETWPAHVPPFAIAALFAAAHLNHLGRGNLGLFFVAAMALQGWLWSSARVAGISLLSLAAAHACLLAAYTAPEIALAGMAVLLAAMGRSFPAWWSSVTRP